jgi:hypothetical protein
MTLPSATETITDGALGAASDNPTATVALIGACSLGTPHQVYTLTQLQSVASTLGVGQLAEQVAQVLSVSRGQVTVLAVPVTSTPGTLGTITHSGTGDGALANSSSAPVDDFDVVAKCVLGGAVGTATLAFSLDGGITFGQPVVTASTYTVPGTGITVAITVTVGFVAGDSYAFTAHGPTFDHTELVAAFAALINDTRRWKAVHVVGLPAGGSDSTRASEGWAQAQALDAQLTACVATSRYAAGFLDGADAADTALEAPYTQSLFQTGVGGGFCLLTSPLTGATKRRPAMWPVFARLAAAPISEDLGRVKSGPLANVGRLKSRGGDPIAWSYHDETFATTKLDSAGFITLRTIPGRPGVYCTQGTMMVAPTSDFVLSQSRLVMNQAATIGHDAMVDELNDGLLVSPTTGFIDEKTAQGLEETVTAELENGLVNAPNSFASSVEFVIVRGTNILQTKLLPYRVRVVPLAYAKQISGDYGFSNPAISAVA